ncbi:MAG: ribosome assembly RNA-binding protein YhbY [Burkholderiaceae bacterium]|jgi:putative YhbY family RNA-binding protein|nr:ribosome assembly RNA-binding protein YhbY [Burkholderiaceae bacterium]
MAEIELTPKERQALKARAHALDPVVLLGAQGLTAAVIKEIDRALAKHELIKVRVPGDDRDEREAMYREVATQLGAARVQCIGKLLVFWRPLPPQEQALRDNRQAVAERSAARARKAATPKSKKAAGNPAQRGKPGRDDIRRSTPRTSAPRRPAGGRSR